MAEAQSPLVVYLVDDDASIRDSLSLMLGLRGYMTRVFSDAESLLVAYDASWLGCVVADLRLPGMNGIALQRQLRQRGSELPFIIITAHGDVPAARAAFLADAVDFIEKPFEEQQLTASIDVRARAECSIRRRGASTPRRSAGRLASAPGRWRCTRPASWRSWKCGTSASWCASRWWRRGGKTLNSETGCGAVDHHDTPYAAEQRVTASRQGRCR
jgi:FixJ family two-component response regulator